LSGVFVGPTVSFESQSRARSNNPAAKEPHATPHKSSRVRNLAQSDRTGQPVLFGSAWNGADRENCAQDSIEFTGSGLLRRVIGVHLQSRLAPSRPTVVRT
jgi:hypothetical protein